MSHRNIVELKSLPMGIARRTGPEINDHVKDRAARAAHKLADARPDLKMHPANDAARRPGMVVLDEVDFGADSDVTEKLASIGLLEEAPPISVDDRLQEDRAIELCLESSQYPSPAMAGGTIAMRPIALR